MTTHQDTTTDDPASVRTEEDLILAAIRQESHPRISRAGTFPTPERIGPYTIVREIGAGGMGIVYEARQEKPLRRTVALKVIKLGMDTRAVVSRFEAERQALATLDHPNIAHIFEAGCTEEGQPYFSMELVHGVHITKYCDEHRLGIRERLDLFIQACEAIQHAHQKGIIHRDIKPSNVLVAEDGGNPAIKIIDFGIAKAADHRFSHETILTEQGQLIGTPEYMSPEHTQLTGCDIDTRTDVYSLGVLLYELLVGELPYDRTRLMACSFSEVQRIICEEEPPHPSERLSKRGSDVVLAASRRGTDPQALRRRIRGDLNWITMKALEKDRDRRYSSVANLAADVDRHLKSEPVSAGPPSRAYRARKFVRRNRALVVGVSAFAALLLVSLVLITALYLRALEEGRVARQQTYYARIAAAEKSLLLNDVAGVHRSLEASPEEFRNWEWRYLDAASDGSTRVFRVREGAVYSVAWSPDGKRVTAGGDDQRAHIWDSTTGEQLAVLGGADGRICSVAYSPDGTRLALAAQEGTLSVWSVPFNGAPVELWRRKEHGAAVESVKFGPKGKRLATGSHDDTVRVWDASTGESVLLPTPGIDRAVLFHSVAFSPDGTLLAAASWQDMSVRIWNVSDLTDLERPVVLEGGLEGGHIGGVSCVAFSPCGAYLVTGSQDHSVRVWDVSKKEVRQVLWGHTATVRSVAFDAGGTRVFSGSDDRTVRIWETQTGKEKGILRGHESPVNSVAFDGERMRLATGSTDGSVRIWDVPDDKERGVFGSHEDAVFAIAFSPDGARLASAGSTNDATIRIWDMLAGDETAVCVGHERAIFSAAFSPDGAVLASGSGDGTMRLWDPLTGREIRTVLRQSNPIHTIAFSPDGRSLATTASEDTACVWDVNTGNLAVRLVGHEASVIDLAYSPDGAHLATTSDDKTIRIWDVTTWRQVHCLVGHEDAVVAVAFNPDGSNLASASYDGTVRIWEMPAGKELAVLPGAGSIGDLAYSPDGLRLAGAAGRTVIVWDATTGETILSLQGGLDPITSVTFSPDGSRILAGGNDWRIRVWDSVPYRGRYEERQALLGSRGAGQGETKR